jgi:hypothetical protein
MMEQSPFKDGHFRVKFYLLKRGGVQQKTENGVEAPTW